MVSMNSASPFKGGSPFVSDTNGGNGDGKGANNDDNYQSKYEFDYGFAIANEALSVSGWERIAESATIGTITLAIIVTNILTIVIILSTYSLRDAVGFYTTSIAIADLLCGILVTPLSVYPAIIQRWVYGEIVCKIEAYVEIMMWCVAIYTFMWMSVDRYLAVRKPQRYESQVSRSRCKCWIVFSWITSFFVSCPPLFGYSKAKYYVQANICLLDWAFIPAYSLSLGILVVSPCMLTIIYCYYYIFREMAEQRAEVASEAEKKGIPCVYPEQFATQQQMYTLTLTMTIVHVLSWVPWCLLQTLELMSGQDAPPTVHFIFMWLSFSTCFTKFLVCMVRNPRFRKGLFKLCMRR